MPKPKALITGVTGQDGSYLAELLLEKGYEVHGMVRRASTEKSERIEHLRDRLTLHQGDLLDQRSLVDAIRASQPDEIYNLAAMSFVAVSWIQPTLTAEFTGVGVTRMLEAMREVRPQARFYQASSSEMFGKVLEVPQTERTPFYPRSPYGVAKAYGHFITVNYRESYGLHATSGVLFNHECLSSSTPLIVRELGHLAVKTPADLIPLRPGGPRIQSHAPRNLIEIWDGEQWTCLRAVTATRRRHDDPDHRLLSVEARGGIVEVTAHHAMLDAAREPLRADAVEAGDDLALGEAMPPPPGWTAVTPELAELLGLLAADGHVSRDCRTTRLTNCDRSVRGRASELWSRCFTGCDTGWTGTPGFDPRASATAIDLPGAGSIGPWLREQLYTASASKQVPPLVLNATAEIQRAFLDGYRAGGGSERGDGVSIETSSAVLAQGLCLLYANQGRPASVCAERRGAETCYQLVLRSAARVGGGGRLPAHRPSEVRRVQAIAPADGEWVFDLETESGVLCAGVGGLVVHNSPRRGLEFVTRKITWHAAAIKLGLEKELRLGNLDAERDWGYAKDYVEAMWLMLQREDPQDYVIATGEAHSVRECCEIAFDEAGLGDHGRYVVVDPQFVRPAEVDHLIGDASKAARELGWRPKTSFEELIRLMTRADLELLSK